MSYFVYEWNVVYLKGNIPFFRMLEDNRNLGTRRSSFYEAVFERVVADCSCIGRVCSNGLGLRFNF